MSFTPRSRKNYIIWKNGRPYYRRAIPARYRHLFGGKTAWVIPLEGRGSAEQKAEAQALAHKHNQQLAFGEVLPDDALNWPDDAEVMIVDLAPANVPPGAPPPTPRHYVRHGQVVEVYKIAITDSPDAQRAAEADGYFVMSRREAEAQEDFHEQFEAYHAASTPEKREIADLKGERAARQAEAAGRVSAETILSILPRWRLQQKQAPATWKKHVQYVTEFAGLHGDLAVSDVTKKHVVGYVAYAQGLLHRGAPLSPTSISKRLDTIRALLAFAVSIDVIEHNPATGAKPPKDTRPKTARSWKSFEPDEVEKIVKVSTALWDKRGNARAEDLKVALQALLWSGARPEEICQLRRDDVDLGRECIRITNDESDDTARARMTKNENSIREVPIHPRLTAALTDHLRRHNSPLLFPTFEPQPTPEEIEAATKSGQKLEIKGRYSRPITREWTDNLREKITNGDPRKVLYSLRHSWAAESRRAGMPEHVRNALMGHADDNPHAGRYGGDADWLLEKRRYVERMVCVPAPALPASSEA